MAVSHSHSPPTLISHAPPPANKAVAINAATMALIDAGVPMKDFVCASSSGYVQDTAIVGKHKRKLCNDDMKKISLLSRPELPGGDC